MANWGNNFSSGLTAGMNLRKEWDRREDRGWDQVGREFYTLRTGDNGENLDGDTLFATRKDSLINFMNREELNEVRNGGTGHNARVSDIKQVGEGKFALEMEWLDKKGNVVSKGPMTDGRTNSDSDTITTGSMMDLVDNIGGFIAGKSKEYHEENKAARGLRGRESLLGEMYPARGSTSQNDGLGAANPAPSAPGVAPPPAQPEPESESELDEGITEPTARAKPLEQLQSELAQLEDIKEQSSGLMSDSILKKNGFNSKEELDATLQKVATDLSMAKETVRDQNVSDEQLYMNDTPVSAYADPAKAQQRVNALFQLKQNIKRDPGMEKDLLTSSGFNSAEEIDSAIAEANLIAAGKIVPEVEPPTLEAAPTTATPAPKAQTPENTVNPGPVTPHLGDAAPRGLRNNNPGNIRKSNIPWQGKTSGNDQSFETFDNMDAGVRAAGKNLDAYYNKHGVKSVAGMIQRWAPSSENNTGAYIDRVAKDLGIDPNKNMTPEEYQKLKPTILKSIFDHENGVDTSSYVQNALSNGVKGANWTKDVTPPTTQAEITQVEETVQNTKPAKRMPRSRREAWLKYAALYPDEVSIETLDRIMHTGRATKRDLSIVKDKKGNYLAVDESTGDVVKSGSTSGGRSGPLTGDDVGQNEYFDNQAENMAESVRPFWASVKDSDGDYEHNSTIVIDDIHRTMENERDLLDQLGFPRDLSNWTAGDTATFMSLYRASRQGERKGEDNIWPIPNEEAVDNRGKLNKSAIRAMAMADGIVRGPGGQQMKIDDIVKQAADSGKKVTREEAIEIAERAMAQKRKGS